MMPEFTPRFFVLYPVVESTEGHPAEEHMRLFLSGAQGMYPVKPIFPKPSQYEFTRIPMLLVTELFFGTDWNPLGKPNITESLLSEPSERAA